MTWRNRGLSSYRIESQLLNFCYKSYHGQYQIRIGKVMTAVKYRYGVTVDQETEEYEEGSIVFTVAQSLDNGSLVVVSLRSNIIRG